MRLGVTPSPLQPRLKYCFEQLSIQRVEYQQVGRTTSGRWLGMWRTDGLRGALAAAVLVALCAATGVFQRAGDTSPLATELSRTVDEAEKALDSDARLAASIQRAGNVFLASRYTLAGGARTPLPANAQRSVMPNPASFAIPATSAQNPVAGIGSVAAGVGHLSVALDEDGHLRGIPLLLRYDDVGVPSLALLAARHSLHLGQNELRVQTEPQGIRMGGLHVV